MRPPAPAVGARWLGDDVLALADPGPVRGAVTARFESAVHVDLDGFVVALLASGAPRSPNGIAVAAGLAGDRAPRVGDPVELTRERFVAGGLVVAWDRDRPPRWDARIEPWAGGPRALARRGHAILATAGDCSPVRVARRALAGIDGFAAGDAGAAAALDGLVGALRSGEPVDAAQAGEELAGRGAGLTPVGDDVLAATALAVTAAGAARGGTRWCRWLAALAPPDLRRRTTSASATMLELALRGRGVAPARELLAPGALEPRQLARELRRLRALGHTTGRAYATTIGAVVLLLGAGEADRTPTTTKEKRTR